MEKKKVLIADDEAHIRLLVRSILGKDYIILEASDGEEAVDMARTERPDLILMDIMMPKLDGVGACYILKSYSGTKGIPVVMLTALTDKLDQEYARNRQSEQQRFYESVCFGAGPHILTLKCVDVVCQLFFVLKCGYKNVLVLNALHKRIDRVVGPIRNN